MQPTNHQVIILGGGFAGIGAAIKLREAGITDFVSPTAHREAETAKAHRG